MGTIKTTNIETITGSGTLTLGQSGETVSVPSGATINVAGTLNKGGVAVANTPSFGAERSGDQSVSNETRTTILFNNEFYDSDSDYDTSTGKFTPQTAGKYFVTANVILNTGANNNYYWGFAELYKNSSVITESKMDDRSAGDARQRTCSLGAIVDMNGSTDFLLVQGYISASISGSTLYVADLSTFQAFKIIE
jgi:hypothetical protein